jgi:hypothetical protein
MILFKPLLKQDYYDKFIKDRLRKDTPNTYRFRNRYGITIKDCETIFPASSHHMFGYVRNVISSLCKNYKHGRSQTLWIKKDYRIDGPRVTKKTPDQADDYRQIIVLNRVDHLIHLLVAHCIKEKLNQDNQLIPVKSQIKNIQTTSEFIKKALSQGCNYYYSTDIKKFGESYDLEKAKNIFIHILEKHMDTEDIVLINNLLSSYQKVPQHRCSGSPINQLFAELILSQIERELTSKISTLFVRSGEDFAFCLMNKNDYLEIETVLASIIKDKGGDLCDLYPAKQISSFYDERYKVNIFNPDDDKGFIGSFCETSMDFCGYNYSGKNEEIVVRIRYKTLYKIKERIREYTEGGNFRTDTLPEISTDKKITKIISKLNGLFGFYLKGNEWRYSRRYGIGELFKLPAGIDSKAILSQAERLNHYMLRRLRHLHMRDVTNNCTLNAKFYREEIDKSYRKSGLRNLLDAINRQKYFSTKPNNV